MMTLQQWRDCEGQTFRLPDGAGLVLKEISVPLAPEGWECFSLLFAGEPTLEQGEVTLRHDQVGEETLFLVPVGPLGATDGTRHFEAVFNRQVASA